MGSGIEERIRELLAAQIGGDSATDCRRVELNGVTIVELRVERMVVVVDNGAPEKA